MNNEKASYNPTPGDYDVEKLTDIHSSESEPSSYARNINQKTNSKGPENIYNSIESVKSKNNVDISSSESEASDTEDIYQSNNLSADNSNTSRSSLSRKSIDLNDDDDDDDNAISNTQLD